MVRLGDISIDIVVNTGDFQTSLEGIIKSLETFSGRLSKALEKGAPKGGGQLLPNAKANIDSVTESVKKLSEQLSNAVTQAGNLSNALPKKMSKSLGGGGKGTGGAAATQKSAESFKNLVMYEKMSADAKERLISRMQPLIQGLVKSGVSAEQLGIKLGVATKGSQEFLKGTIMVGKSSEEMAKRFDNSIMGTIRGLANFRKFFAQIMHYITFTVGVQLVMQLRQAFRSMIETTKEFERAATNAATVSGFLGEAFADVRDHIMDVSKQLGKTTVFAATDVAKAFYNLASAGYEVAELSQRDLLPILNYAAATQATLEDATYAVATALKAFKLELTDSIRVVDVFTGAITNSFMTFDKMREAMKYVGPIAGSLGMSLEETTSALMLLVDRGMEGSQAGQRLNMIFTKLLKPTDKTTKMLASMGLTMEDLNPEVFTLTQILYKLKAAGFGAAEAATMFRARTAASAAVLVDSVDSIARYNQMLSVTSGITEGVAEQQEKTLWGALQLMSNALQEAGLDIGEELIPALTALAGVVKTHILPGLMLVINIFKQLYPILKVVIPAFIAYKGALVVLRTAMGVYIAYKKIQLALYAEEGMALKALTILWGEKTAKVWADVLAQRADVTAMKAANATRMSGLAGFIRNIKAMYQYNLALRQNKLELINTSIMGKKAAAGTLQHKASVLSATIAQKQYEAMQLRVNAAQLQAVPAETTKRLQMLMKARMIDTQVMDLQAKKLALLKTMRLHGVTAQIFEHKVMWKNVAARKLQIALLKKEGVASIFLIGKKFKLALANLAVSKSYLAAAAGAKAFGAALKTLLLNPVFLIIAAIVTIIMLVAMFIRQLDQATTALDDFVGIKLTNLRDEFSATEAAIFEAASTTKDLNEAIRVLTRDGAYEMKEFGEEVEGAMKMEKLLKFIGEPHSMAFGLVDFVADMFDFEIPILSGVSNWINEQIIGLLGMRDQIAENKEEAEKFAIAMAAATLGLSVEQIETMFEAKKIVVLLASEVVNYSNAIEHLEGAIKDYELAEEDLIDVRERISQVGEADSALLDELIEKEEKFRLARQDRAKLETELLGSIKLLIQEARHHSEELDKGIQYIEDWNQALIDRRNREEDLERVMIDEEKAALNLAEAIATYGSTSDEAAKAEQRLLKVSKDRAEIEGDIADLTAEAAAAKERYEYTLQYGVTGEFTYEELTAKGFEHSEIEEMLKEAGKASDFTEEFMKNEKSVEVTYALTEAQKALLELTKELSDARRKYTVQLGDQTILDAKIAGLEMVRDKFLTLTNEKLKLYLENQKKVLDIEEKIYKLREGEKDQLDDLFSKLADEGLVNEEIIDLYKEMMTAEGEVLGMNHALMGVYGDLQDGERELVEQYINGEISLGELNEKLAEYYAISGDTTKITEGQMAVIQDYKDASDRLTAAVAAFGDVLGPLMQDLIDAGVVSPAIAEAWGDIADNALESASANIDLAIAQAKVNDSMVGLIGNAVRLAKALLDENVIMEGGRDAALDLFDTYAEFDEEGNEVENAGKSVIEVLLQQMGVWDSMGGNIDAVMATLQAFYPESDNVTDSMILNAAAMIQAAQAAGLWEAGMAGADLAAEMNVGSLQQLMNESEAAWKAEDAMVELMEDLEDAINSTASALNDLTDVLNKFVSLSAGEHMLDIGLKYSFAELMDVNYKEGLKALFEDMAEEGATLGADMMTAWSELDWQKWTESIKDSKFGKELEKELNKIEPELDFSKMWGGVSEDEFGDLIESNLDDYATIFEMFEVIAHIESKWDNVDFYSFLSSLPTNFSAIQSAMTTAGLDFPIESSWDNLDWYSFLTDTSTDLASFQSVLTAAGVEVPVDLDDNFTAAAKAAKSGLQTDLDGDHAIATLDADTTGAETSFSTFLSTLKTTMGEGGEEMGKNMARGFGTTLLDGLIAILKGIKNQLPLGGLLLGGVFDTGIQALEAMKTSMQVEPEGAESVSFDLIPNLQSGIEGSSHLWKTNVDGSVSVWKEGVDGALTRWDIGVNGSKDVWNIGVDGSIQRWAIGVDGAAIQVGLAATDSRQTIVEGMSQAVEILDTEVEDSAKFFGKQTITAGGVLNMQLMTSAMAISHAARELNNAKITIHRVTTVRTVGAGVRAKGGIEGLQHGIKETLGPTFAMIGEAGPEAVVPLAGKFKGRGADILKYIVPKYFPEMMMQTGMMSDQRWRGGKPGKQRKPDILIYDPMLQLIMAINRLTKVIEYQFIKAFIDFKHDIIGPMPRQPTPYKSFIPDDARLPRFRRGGVAKGPTLGMFGEKGAEALVPLEGGNKRFGRAILEEIIPSYYPELLNQRGGIYSPTYSTVNNETTEETFSILGPINVNAVANAEDFTNELKFKMRASTRK